MSVSDATEPAALAQAAVFRNMTPTNRLLRTFQMSDLMIEIAEEGIRSRHLDYDDADVQMASARLRLSDDLYRQAYAGRPLLDP